jgi:hypothetical protein
VEFFVPAGREPHACRSRAAASHVFTSPSSRFTKRVQDIGTAALQRGRPVLALASNSAFRNAVESVAQMVFNDAGFTMLCTGTLLADGNAATQTPWFYSANHCFENEDPPYKNAVQMQTVANTLTTLWGFEASSCNSRTPRAGWSQVSGGAHADLRQRHLGRAVPAPERRAAFRRFLLGLGRQPAHRGHRPRHAAPSGG